MTEPCAEPCCVARRAARQVDRRLLQEAVWDINDCLLWMGYVRADGYGVLWLDGRKQQVHRLAYAAFVGPIPLGLTIDHLCRVKHCIAPAHLEAVSGAENSRRAASARRLKTHCRRDHVYDAANTGIDNRGNRFCRTCNRDQMRRRRAVIPA